MASPTEFVPLSVAPETPLVTLLKAAWTGWAWELKRWFLPHLLGGIGLFLLVAYVTAKGLFSAWPAAYQWLGGCFLLAFYGIGAFGFSLFTACVFALRAACVHWNDLIDGVLELVQTQTAGRVADMNVGLSKPQARKLVSGSVREVFSSLRPYETPLPRLFLWLGLGAIATAVRVVLAAKISKWATRTVQLSKVFAGRATLVGAVFLNLHFFATLVLAACYAFAAAVVILNIYLVFLVK